MNHKKAFLILFLTCFFSIFFCLKIQTVSRANENNSAEQISIKSDEKSNMDITINYQPEHKKNTILTITSNNIKNININSLIQEFGDSNVKINDDDIILTSSNIESESSRITFKLSILKKINTSIQIQDKTNNQKSNYDFNFGKEIPTSDNEEVESSDSSNIDPNQFEEEQNTTKESKIGEDWIRSAKLKVSSGKVVNRNGKQIIPVMYFGALNYALEKTSIKDSVGPRKTAYLVDAIGHGRLNNITAANSAIIVAPLDSKPLDNPEQVHNPDYGYYATTFADGDVGKNHNSYFGSQRNFVTTNISEFSRSKGKESLTPRIRGVDTDGLWSKAPDETMDKSSVKFYTRQDPDTNLEMQRIVFNQKNNKYIIQVTITQKFLDDGSIEIQTEFKNLGKNITHFTGFTFRDVTFMKNGDFDHRDSKNKLLSLGNNEGIYSSRDLNDGRIEFKLNGLDDSPFGWAGRGTRSTFYDGDGGNDSFPWASIPNSNIFDAFENVKDTGDKKNLIPAGKAWIEDGLIGEKGISMHTGDNNLLNGHSMTMTYQTKLIEKTDDIELRMYNDNPDLLTQDELKKFVIFGNWHHYNDTKINLKYEIDSPDESPEYLLKNGKKIYNNFVHQSSDEKHRGVLHDWKKGITNLSDYAPGYHKISVIAYDSHGNYSKIKPVNIVIPGKISTVPTIKVYLPTSNSQNKPYETFNNTLTISGIWTAKSENNLNITYSVDDGQEITLEENLKNTDGRNVKFTLHNFDFQKLDKKAIHHIKFTIHDPDSSSKSDTFYFKHKNGTIELLYPQDILFGTHNLPPNQTKTVHPKINGQLSLIDYRSMDSSPLDLVLHIHELKDKSNQKLNYQLEWNKSPIKSDDRLIVHKKIMPQQNEWISVTNIKNLSKKMRLRFNNKINLPGVYKSTWCWDLVDSVN